MHDIEHLEKKWEKYNRNKRRPYYVIILVLILLLLTSGYILYDTKNKANPSNEQTAHTENNSIQTSIAYISLLNGPLITLLEDNRSKEVSNPLDTESTTSPVLPIVKNIPILEERKKVRKNVVMTKPKEIPRKKMHLNILKTSSISAYKEVEKRFNQFKDPDDSLFLAKSYYEKKAYKKSEYWALKTNKINNSIDESWLIFAKSKVKLGYKKEAIHILLKYIQQSNSVEAKKLLLKLKK